jgi:hypothetical protein
VLPPLLAAGAVTPILGAGVADASVVAVPVLPQAVSKQTSNNNSTLTLNEDNLIVFFIIVNPFIL